MIDTLYANDMTRVMKIMTRNTNISDNQLHQFAKDNFDTNRVDVRCSILNNYKNKRVNNNLYSIVNWYHDKKPIPCESGVFFRKHDESINLNVAFLEEGLARRKEEKKLKFEYMESGDFEKSKYYDLRQLATKISVNAFYGISGQKASFFYNIHVATSITGKAQSIIMEAVSLFEGMFGDNIKFDSMDECLIFIANVIEGDLSISPYLDRHITIDEVETRLVNNFTNPDDIDFVVLGEFLSKLTQAELDCVYYRNNFVEFISSGPGRGFIWEIIDGCDSFNDPNKLPDSVRSYIVQLWMLVSKFVMHDYPVYNKIRKIKKMERNAVIYVDTDSNYINLGQFMDNIFGDSERNDVDTTKVVNILTFIAQQAIAKKYYDYTTRCNVPVDKRPRIAMKNEYYMSRMILTSGKKNYTSKLILQEGNVVPPHKSVDIKGLPIKKANVNSRTAKYLSDILDFEILSPNDINVSSVLSKLKALETLIRDSLLNGEKDFATPAKVKELESYANPYRESQARCSMIYNLLFPDTPIVYPSHIFKIKTKIKKIDDMSDMYDNNPEMYQLIKDRIFGDENLAHHGLNFFGFPRNLDRIPEFIIPYIDVDSIIQDNIKPMLSILSSIGLKPIMTKSNSEYYSNIIDF